MTLQRSSETGRTRSGIETPLVLCEPFTKVNRLIAEGRKAFLARVESIESGEECDRWAPVVSAMSDGEATPEEVLDARPHLRNCAACRATVREMPRHSASIAALFPVGALAAAEPAGAGHDPGGLVVRLYEAVAGALHERGAASALKLQAALDATSAGKIAAVAASAAAVAGGGIAVVEPVTGHHGRREHSARYTARAAAAGAAARRPAPAPAPADADSRSTARRKSAASREFGSDGGGSSRQVAREFTDGAPSATAAGARRPVASPPPARLRRAAPADAEFAP